MSTHGQPQPVMTTAPSKTADRTTPHVDDVAAAMAEVERAMAILDRAIPSCKFKVSCLHRLTLFMKAGRRSCRDCGAEWQLTASEADWCHDRGYAQPTRCKACRTERRRAREIGPFS
jgi:hypothetical protein